MHVPAWAKGRRIHFLPSSPAESPYVGSGAGAARHAGLAARGGNASGAEGEAEEVGGGPLRYSEGGTVQHKVNVHIILWGKNFKPSSEGGTSEGEATATILKEMYAGFNKSAYQGTLTQYFDPTSRVSIENTESNAWIDESEPAPTNLKPEGLGKEIEKALRANKGNGWTVEPNAQYIVATAPGSTYSEFGGGFCAFHGFVEGGAFNGAVYDFLPFPGDPRFRGGCIGEDVQSNPVHADSKFASHEYSEAATDPFVYCGLGWRTAGCGGEIGDLCNFVGDREVPGTHSWAQPEYDDHFGGCSYKDPTPPHVLGLTEAATGVGQHEATLQATVNPESEPNTSYYFEYGTTTAYGARFPASNAAVETNRKNNLVAQKLSGLSNETLYHYRVVATNATGTTRGEDHTFGTSPWGPRQEIQNPSESFGVFTFGTILLSCSESPRSCGGVSCPAMESCMAAGSYYTNGIEPPLFELSNGSKWTWEPAGIPEEGARLNQPTGIAYDSGGDVWVVDSLHYRIAEYSPEGKWLRDFGWGVADGASQLETCTKTCRNGIPGSAPGQLGEQVGGGEPMGIAVASQSAGGEIWIADPGNKRVEEYKPEASAVKFEREIGQSEAEESYRPSDPLGVAVDGLGNVWVTDAARNLVDEYSATGAPKLQFESAGGPDGIALDAFEHVWVSDVNAARVQEFSAAEHPANRMIATYGWGVNSGGHAKLEVCVQSCIAGLAGSGKGQFNAPTGIAIDPNGNVWVMERNNGRAQELTPSGEYLTQFGEFAGPAGIAISPAGAIDVTDTGNLRVLEYSLPGIVGGTPTFDRELPIAVRYVATTGISCTTINACVSVGFDENRSGIHQPVAYSWNGSAWSLMEVPSPSGTSQAELQAVSCTSASECMAVGTSLGSSGWQSFTSLLKGNVWTTESSPNPSGSTRTILEGVSCPSAGFCAAVGLSNSSSGAQSVIGENWNGATSTWTEVTTVTPPESAEAELFGVSCASPSACETVGNYRTGSGESQHYTSLAERWAGGSAWSLQPTAHPGKNEELVGVSCVNGEDCTAVGSAQIGLYWEPTVQNWNGEGWHLQTNNNNGGEAAELRAVSCNMESACTAVGGVGSAGQLRSRTGGYNILIEPRAETGMGSQPTPAPSGSTSATISGSSCTSPKSCVAVGSYKPSAAGAPLSLADEWTGLEWKSQAPATPRGATSTELRRVSCTGPAACVAVGSYVSSSGKREALAEQLGTSGWQLNLPPNPKEGTRETRLAGVSCTAATSCYAVGSYKSSAGVLTALVERLNGSTWEIIQQASPAGATTSALFDVACPASGACAAVGSYTNATSETLSLAESLSGTTFQKQTTPNPPGAKNVELSGVSCPSAGTCTAVGSYTSAQNALTALAESLAGGSWQLQALAPPPGATASALAGVSCTAAGTCSAVGHWSLGGAQVPLAELWNGHEWHTWATSSPTGLESGELLSVSCLTMHSCESVGSYTSAHAQKGLAEGLGAPGVGPKAESTAASDVVTLSGRAYANQWPTREYFEYGTTTNYGSSTPTLGEHALSPGPASEVQAIATGLTAGKTYDFRLVAQNEAGTAYSENQTVTAPNPTVTEVKPNAGPQAGGTQVTITGTNFGGITGVKFGTRNATEFKVESATKITATAPPGSGTVDVTVSSPSVTTETSAADHFTYVPPAVTEVKPNTGPQAGGTQVTITGTNFVGITGVNFGTTTATEFKVISETQLTAIAPPGSGTVDITLSTAGGESALTAADKFSYLPPEVTAVNPNSGPQAGGTPVTITGSNFVGVTSVKFGQVPATNVQVRSQTKITATAPPGSGTVEVTVFTAGGFSAPALGAQYNYLPPAIVEVTPSTGPEAGGTPVTITGSNFAGITAVEFANVPARSFTVESEGKITAVSPPGGGTANIVVRTAGGSSAITPADHFTYEAIAPTFASSFGEVGSGAGQLSSPSGVAVDVSGNVWVSDRGNNRVDEFSPTGAFKLAFGWGVSDGAQKLETCTAGCRAGLTGAGNAEFGNPEHYGYQLMGIVATGGHIWVLDSGNLRLLEFSTSGEYLNKQITGVLIGANGLAADAAGNLYVSDYGYGGVQVFSATSGEQLRLFYPADTAPKYGVAVDAQGNVWTTSTYYHRIDESSSEGAFMMMVGWGVKDGAQKLETCTENCREGIAGSGNGQFVNPAGIVVDDLNTIWVVESSNSRVQRFNPAGEYVTQFGSAGSGPGQLSGPQGIAATNGALWVADTGNNRIERWTDSTVTPFVTSITPNAGAEAGGTSVTITGTGFGGATGVSFGEHAASSFEVISDTVIKATAPAGTGTVDVKVTTPGGASAVVTADKFTYVAAPSVTSLQPSSGSEAGGARVTITGTGFVSGATSVAFGANPATNVEVISATEAKATAPAGTGAVDVKVTTPGGTSAVVAGDKFTYGAPPTVTGIQPVVGPAAGATKVTITGANFLSGATVAFGEAQASGVEVISATEVRATAPAGKGTVDVRVSTQYGTSATSPADQFTYESPTTPFIANFGQTGSGSGQLNEPRGVAVDSSGNVWVDDFLNHRIDEFGREGTTFKLAFGWGVQDGAAKLESCTQECSGGIAGSGAGQLGEAGGSGSAAGKQLAVAGGDVWIVDTGNERVEEYTTSGQYLRAISTPSPDGLAIDPSGNVWVHSYGSGTVFEYSSLTGEQLRSFNTAFQGESEIAIDSLGDVWLTRGEYNRVEEYSSAGTFMLAFGWGVKDGAAKLETCTAECRAGNAGAGQGQFNFPRGIAIDNMNTIWVADWQNNRVERFTLSGEYLGQLGTAGSGPGQLSGPHGIAIANESIDVADTNNNRIARFGPLPPVLTSLQPNTGSEQGGTQVAIHGYGMGSVRAVRFGEKLATALTVDSETEVTATAPAGTGTVDVTVTNSEGTPSSTNAADKFTYYPPPTVTGVQPNFGPTAGGTQVTITGTQFIGVTGVSFGHTPATNVTVKSETEITATSPAGSGTVDVTVSARGGPNGPSAADTFAYESLAPTFASSFGESGSGAGQLSSPDGATVDEGGNVWVSDHTNNRVDEFSSTGQFKLAFGWGVSDGAQKLETCTASCRAGFTGAGTAEFGNPENYGYQLMGIVATGGHIWVLDSGNLRLLEFSTSGEYLNKQITGVLIGANGLAADAAGNFYVSDYGYGEVQVFSATSGEQLRVFAPADGAPKAGVAVDAQGNVWTTSSYYNRIVESSSEGVLKMVVGWGVKDGAEKLETCTSECKPGIAGAGIGQFNGPNGITVDTNGDLWVVDGANNRVQGFTTQGEYITQFGSLGSGPGQLSGPLGIAATNGALLVADTSNDRIERWTHIPPNLTSVEPNAGPEAGGTSVTIHGHGFRDVRAVKFGAKLATGVTVKSETEITAIAPAGSGAVDVTVVTGEGVTPLSAADKFTHYPPPTVSSITPKEGPTGGGTRVTITGTNFVSGATTVAFGANTGANVEVVSATEAKATSPAGALGTVDVEVTTPGGTSSAVAGDKFAYVPAPTVSSITPKEGPTAGGTRVTIAGTNFVSGATTVAFGANTGANVEVVSATEAKATSPAGAAGTVDVEVTTPGDTSSAVAGDKFTYIPPPPTVSSITPKEGPTGGGTRVTITGTNFVSGATTVAFGANTGANVEVVSATEAKATSPAGAAGTVDVEVTTSGGTSSAVAGDKFTYVPPPTITGVQPNFGPTAGGTQVTITGTKFISVTGVSFGQTPATNVTVKSETEITATSPAGSGTVDVVVSALGGVSAPSPADTFAYESLAPTFATSFGEVGSGAGQLSSPAGATVDESGNVWVADRANNRVDEFSPTGVFKLAFGWGVSDGEAKLETCTASCRAGLTGAGTAEFGNPEHYGYQLMGIVATGGHIWVLDSGNLRLLEFSTSGEYLNKQITGVLIGANGIAADAAGNFYVSDYGYGEVQVFSATSGEQLRVFAPADGAPKYGVTVDAQGNVWTTSSYYHRIVESSSEGVLKMVVGWGVKDGAEKLETCTSECKPGIAGAGIGQFNGPNGITVDTNGDLWVVDGANNRVQGFTTQGEYITQFGSVGSGPGQLSGPLGIAATNGALLVADTSNNRIERWTHIPPIVTSVEPNAGPETGGTTVTIHGHGFSGVRAVKFGEKLATGVTVKSETEITAIAPAGSGAVDVTVVTTEGTSATSPADKFTY